MIYSTSYNFLFCHVPKTGGTSFSSAFYPYCSHFEQSRLAKLLRRIPGSERSRHLYDFTHRPHTTCAKAYRLLSHRYDDLFSFALMREPVSWLYSSFRHFKRHNMRMKHITSKSQPCDFADFVEELISIGDRKPCQSFMLIDENAMVRMKSIGNYDQLVDYFSWICKVIGFTDPPKLPHKNLNLSFRNDYVDHISDTVVSLIRDYWHNDFFLFDKIIESGSTNYQEYCEPLPLAPNIDLVTYDPWGYMVSSD